MHSTMISYKTSDLPIKWCNSTSNDFNKLLRSSWNKIHDTKEVFRYKIDKLEEKIVDKYLIQLNPNRGCKRRVPESFANVYQKFNSDLFNFTKVKEQEIIMNINNDNGKGMMNIKEAKEVCQDSNRWHLIVSAYPSWFKSRDDRDVFDTFTIKIIYYTEYFEEVEHCILVNVSPISRYHSLICPFINKCLPQVITLDSFILALELVFLFQDRDMRIGFNSLCALASVNHLHYHILVETNDLPVEYVKCKHLAGNLFVFDSSYPVPAFCFQIDRSNDIENISKEVYNLLGFLIQENVAHNVLLTRGLDLNGGNREVIRIVIWPRKTSSGVKNLQAFNVAVCELSGWFPIFNRDDFENMTSSILEEELKKWKLEFFEELANKVKELYALGTK